MIALVGPSATISFSQRQRALLTLPRIAGSVVTVFTPLLRVKLHAVTRQTHELRRI